MTATVAPPTGNQFGVLLAIFLVITFATVVVLWVHERRWDRHEAEIAIHHEQLATLAGRLQSLTDFLQVDVHDARDDSPQALADTDEIPVLPPTEPMAVVNPTPAVQARRDAAWDEQRPSPVPRDLSGEFPHPVDSDERKAKTAADIEAALKQFNFTGRNR